jgi:hypothetical protein
MITAISNFKFQISNKPGSHSRCQPASPFEI